MIAKCILQDNHESLLQSVGGNFATLINTDGGVKSAASDVIPRSVIETFRPPMNKFATHIIAMGDEEHYGPNRNGDSWPGEGLAKNAYTFVSNGHLFREHNNSNPDRAIGEIKYAAYDPHLGRVELLVWGDKEKAAKEWEHMKKGNALSGSMSARVPWDECSVCGNRAKTPREYCKHAAHHMGQYLPEHKKYAFVRNPHPKFFDYSFVEHPADSIAWGIEYDPNIAKAASVSWTSNICNGADLARAMGVMFPDEKTSDPSVLKFASIEDDMRMIARTGAGSSSYQFIKGASEAVRDISDHEIISFRKAKPYTVFYELAKAGCVLPFESFCAYALNKTASAVKSMPSVKKASLDILPLIYSLLKETTGLDETISQYRNDMAACRDEATCSCDPGRPDVIDSLMNSADEKFNMGDDAMKNRITVTIIKFGSARATSIVPVCTEEEQYEAMKLASWYAAYQMQAVEDIARFHGTSFAEKVARYLIAQNVSPLAL